MIIYGEDGLIDLGKLNKQEKELFIVFLRHEKNRHLDDIYKINQTINIMEKEVESNE